MRTHRRHRPAAAALLLAAALALTGCSSSSSSSSDAAATESPSERSAAERVEEQVDEGGDEQDGDEQDGGRKSAAPSEPAGPGPVRPDSDITPATGSFSKDEKKYLSGRVPESVEPAAVLDLGKESCQRIERTAKRDQDAAVAAVVAGDIRNAADAVTHLCPEQKPVLDAAEGGYPDGTHDTPAAGRYRALSAGPDCTWGVTDAKGKELASGPGPGADDTHTLTIPSGAAEFTSSGCYAWVRA